MANSRTWSRYTVSSIGSMKRKLSSPFRAFRLRAETGKNRRRALPQISRRAGHFPLLIQRSRVEFDLRPNPALVVVEPFEFDAHPVVLIAALVAKNERRAAKLCNDQICIAVSVDIGNCDRTRLTQLDLVETNILCDVGPAFLPQISQQSQLRSVARLTRCNQIDPAVIVVIKCRNPPTL